VTKCKIFMFYHFPTIAVQKWKLVAFTEQWQRCCDEKEISKITAYFIFPPWINKVDWLYRINFISAMVSKHLKKTLNVTLHKTFHIIKVLSGKLKITEFSFSKNTKILIKKQTKSECQQAFNKSSNRICNS